MPSKMCCALEVSEHHVGHELLIVEAERFYEFLFGDSVEHVAESFLISVTDKLIDEGSIALMSPETDKEEFRSHLFLNIRAVLDNFVFWLLCNIADTLENTSKFTNIESIMELGWSWQESSLDGIPNSDGGINEIWSHVDDFWSILLGVEKNLKNSTIDVLDRFLGWWGHVD